MIYPERNIHQSPRRSKYCHGLPLLAPRWPSGTGRYLPAQNAYIGWILKFFSRAKTLYGTKILDIHVMSSVGFKGK